jgi:hypothetical protein
VLQNVMATATISAAINIAHAHSGARTSMSLYV